MNTKETQRSEAAMKTVVATMWQNWAVAFGVIVLPILCSLVFKRAWLPLICLVEIYLLASLRRGRRSNWLRGCSLPVRTAERILFISMVVMLAIDILCTDWLIPAVLHLELYNQEIPFITCLVVFPAAVLVCAISLLTGVNDNRCRDCRRVNNLYAGDNIIGTAYFRESKYQIMLLLLLSLLLGGAEYWYYFDRYINSDINEPDRFFFIYMPVVVYIVSLGVMWARYANLYSLYMSIDEASPERNDTTRVRYLVFCDNDLLLHKGENELWDTPIETIISHRNSMDDEDARMLFSELTSITDFQLRYCYTSDDLAPGANTMHYGVFVDGEASVGIGTQEDRWFNAYMLDCALQGGELAGTLANELFRIHTITMAWKTYDRDGKRLYPMKHYRPTFRFSDMPGWKVDYDDTSWFGVAYNNEDRRFFRLRAFWRRITGVFAPRRQVQ